MQETNFNTSDHILTNDHIKTISWLSELTINNERTFSFMHLSEKMLKHNYLQSGVLLMLLLQDRTAIDKPGVE